ncbi:hypothetical protein [Clostridium sp. AF22-10]|mgnify:CR=1 FL=1|uniref:hypothetical protein n=1 Tax=Clostridium sp. AF22-10 TaxID=2293004 RepID=UPI000E4C3305|nr:hypothetical protein DWX91_15560 [Clostridium sp. AF22-10]
MKKTIRILAVIIAMTCIFSGTAFAQEKEVAVEKSSSIARADVIKYVYKVENGKLYRRYIIILRIRGWEIGNCVTKVII